MPCSIEASTLVATANGHVRADRLVAGDILYSHLGEPVKLLEVGGPSPEPAVSVTLLLATRSKRGTTQLVLGMDQRIRSWTSEMRERLQDTSIPAGKRFRYMVPPNWWQLTESLPAELVACSLGRWLDDDTTWEYAHSIPLAKPLMAPDRELPIDPYALGFAHANKPRSIDPTAPNMLYVHSKARTWALKKLKPAFPGLEVIHAPARGTNWSRIWLPDDALPPIPSEYALASPDQRYALLDGLVDSFTTDSYRGNGGKAGVVRIRVRDEASARVLEQLVASLGWDIGVGARPRVTEHSSYGRPNDYWWEMRLRPTRRLGQAPQLKRRQLGHYAYVPSVAKTVQSLEYLGTRDIVRLHVDSPSLVVGRRNFTLPT